MSAMDIMTIQRWRQVKLLRNLGGGWLLFLILKKLPLNTHKEIMRSNGMRGLCSNRANGLFKFKQALYLVIE